MTKRSKRFFQDVLEQTRQLIAEGDLTPEQRAEAEAYCANMSNVSEQDLATYNFFFTHMPEEDDDVALIILKGHLLVELRTREFVVERLQAPDALDAARLTSHQLICLAESLCLPNPDPKWLWSTARQLNSLRNKLAHNLEPKDLEKEIRAFTILFKGQNLAGGTLIGCIGNLYSQVAALADISRSKEYKVRGRSAT